MNILDTYGKIITDNSVEAKRKRYKENNKGYIYEFGGLVRGLEENHAVIKNTVKTMANFSLFYAGKFSSNDLCAALRETKAILYEDGSLDIECPNDIIQSIISDYIEDSDRNYIAKYFGDNAWDFGLSIKEDARDTGGEDWRQIIIFQQYLREGEKIDPGSLKIFNGMLSYSINRRATLVDFKNKTHEEYFLSVEGGDIIYNYKEDERDAGDESDFIDKSKDHYVLVAENPDDEYGPIVWETYIGGGSPIKEVVDHQARLGGKYGKTKIAKLVFLD